ncbi:PaaI family thioesterase [Thalassobius vesicularis]|uniref:PaaI family thioesterase n=1 Tax=Thalassobius vesicularis TaxID=1294297 RepID=A0A4S3MB31_9RHOB|nr:PaaI family thioesterase [Thalassobius vesicularis]THD75795.1 PaaI family thioesterase [Thalassobius vesicularis]
MTLTTADAQAFLEQGFAPWVKALDLTVEEVGPELTVLSMPITDQLARMGGIISGQALAAMADTSMAIGCLAHFGEMRPIATTNLDTQFLRPGTGDRIRCEARIVRAGKQLVFCNATMIALPLDKPVATATATFFCP